MHIKYYARSNWGTTHLYIFDETISENVSCLTNKKTIDSGDISALKALGFTFELILDPELAIAA